MSANKVSTQMAETKVERLSRNRGVLARRRRSARRLPVERAHRQLAGRDDAHVVDHRTDARDLAGGFLDDRFLVAGFDIAFEGDDAIADAHLKRLADMAQPFADRRVEGAGEFGVGSRKTRTSRSHGRLVGCVTQPRVG